MPSLKRAQLAATPGTFAASRTTLSAGDVWVTSPRDDCDWRTVRPEHAADSAQRAHLIAHRKGWI